MHFTAKNRMVPVCVACSLLVAFLLGCAGSARAQDAVEPYLGEIMLVAFDFTPRNWADCSGQLLPINQNQALFSLLGTTYGGNGTTTFALPDLRGRVPMHARNVLQLGQQGGEEAHTLAIGELPVHTHVFNASDNAGDATGPENNFPARDANSEKTYGSGVTATMDPAAISPAGGSQPHENRMPYVALHYIIALSGIFPSHGYQPDSGIR
jgi:microcystin-dependent protein